MASNASKGPQGSILGPLLLLMIINDLQLNFPTTKCVLFADDAFLYVADSENCIRKITNCFNNRLIKIYLSKRKYI